MTAHQAHHYNYYSSISITWSKIASSKIHVKFSAIEAKSVHGKRNFNIYHSTVTEGRKQFCVFVRYLFSSEMQTIHISSRLTQEG